jgi:RNA polymerase sigma factor (sigma-70 family)
MEEQDSIQLLKNIASGSRTAFHTFYEKYISFVYQIAFSILHDQPEAEDVCHDVFLEILQKANQYSQKKGSVEAWIAVKTKSRSIDRLRKNKLLLVNRLEQLIDKKGRVKGADLQFLRLFEKNLVLDALKYLPVEQREAIIRSYFRGETHREIAKTMQKPLGTVKSLIRYGLNNLRKQKTLKDWLEPKRGEKKSEI